MSSECFGVRVTDVYQWCFHNLPPMSPLEHQAFCEHEISKGPFECSITLEQKAEQCISQNVELLL